jgi:hypothetical protein
MIAVTIDGVAHEAITSERLIQRVAGANRNAMATGDTAGFSNC